MFNVFGPRQDSKSKYAVVVPKFIQSCLKNEPLIVHGTGKQSRDFTYIDNVVSANILAMTAKNVSGMVFNVACHERFSVLDIAYTVSKILNTKPKFIFEPRRAGDVMHTFADISLAKKHLNYKPLVSFKEGMKKTVEYFKETI